MKRAPIPYLLLGLAAAGERRSREVASVGVRAAAVVAWPAARGWNSSLAAPLRHRADDVSADLAREGEEIVEQARARLQAAFDRAVAIAIHHPATEALVVKALDDPGLDPLIARVMESRMVDELTARLLESEELKLVLDYVTRSPELRAALAHQTAGIAEDVAISVRTRTVAADDAAERFARGLIRRRRRPEAR
ncbi:MAG TPA: hypothetical protein VGL51_07425 [Solirubrobacteraceae bacterium]